MSTTSNYRKHPAKKLVCLLLTLTLRSGLCRRDA